MTPAAGIAAAGRLASGLCARLGDRLRRFAAALAAAAIGLGLTAVATVVANSADRLLTQVEFGVLVENRRLLTQDGLRDIEQALEAVRELFEFSQPGIDRSAFEALTQPLLEQVPGLGEVAWMPRVPAAQRNAFDREAAREGLPGYRIAIPAAEAPAGSGTDRPEFFPILYASGRLADPALRGTDIAVDPNLGPLLERARDRGRLAASPPVEIAGAAGPGRVVYLLAPVQRHGESRGTVEERRRGLAGFVEFVLDPAATIQKIHSRVTSPRGLDFYFYRAGAGSKALPFYVRASFLRDGPAPMLARAGAETGLYATVSLVFGDARWLMVVRPVPGGPLSALGGRVWIVLTAGVLVTGMIVAWIAGATRHAESLEALLAQLRRRDAILDAVTIIAARLSDNSTIDEAMPEALRIAGEAVGVDRMLVLEATPAVEGGAPVSLRYSWQAPELPIIAGRGNFGGPGPEPRDLADWRAALRAGRVVAVQRGSAPGAGEDLLRNFGIASLLVVPIFVDGGYWGQISFEDCRRERRWSAAEIDALKVFAELTGSAIERARRIRALADADTIVAGSPTVLYRIGGEPPLPLTYVSRNVSRILGYEASRLVASPTLYRTLIHPEDGTVLTTGLRDITEGRLEASVFEFRLRAANGAYRWFETRAAARRDPAGRLLDIQGLLIDMTERKEAEQRIAALARTDPLTGLANRTSFLDRLALAFASARRGSGAFAVLSLDLDRFKEVNDTLGHPAGDALLQQAAQRIAGSLRDIDLVARFGGDEFAILQAETGDPAATGAFVQRICARLAMPYLIEGNEVRLTASVGIAPYTTDVASPEELLAQADRALYRAKEEGRDRYRFHSEKIDAVVHEQIALAAELRAALGGDQLELFYQPQVSVQSGAVVGMEALLRWRHPRRGLLRPGEFIPIAERSGIIVALGNWVLDHAARQLRLWRDEGLSPPIMAINLSAAQLKLGRKFEREVAATLEKWRLSPSDLEFDVGEAVLLDTTRGNPDALERLRQLGVGIAIDDFGSDYTAIGRLRACHVKRFKIAPHLIDAMTQSAEDAAVVRAMISLARQLDIGVIAEGVETERQRAFLLSETSAAAAQGYYFSRPVPAGVAGEILRRGVVPPAPGDAALAAG